ncbi:TRAF4 [Cordylochernes scorpioides]|uniref:TRAF4 n=1 Tax=Cordylochernes scorpioides TaxID=51811 RepID=A0ABY6KNE4_9ARAC|nr:TRAF4 [Cordylochernes scorpioides]
MENTCPFQGCSQTFSNLLEAMLHSTLCQFSLVDCPQSCGTKILRKDLAFNMTVACKPLFGSCQFCGAVLTRDSLQQHEVLCGQIGVSPGESVHSDSKNPQSCSLLDQGCRNEADVCLKEKDEKLLIVYLPLLCDSLRDISLEMSQCKNLLKENLDQIKVGNEFRGESLESPIIQLLQEINSSMKAQSGEKENLKAWQREMSGLMAAMTRQLETSQASLSQILVNQRSAGSSQAEVQNLTAMLSNKIEDISNQHLVDLGYIRTELEGVKSELSTGPTTTSLGEDHLQGLERDLKNTKEELETVKAGFQGTINELSTMKTELQGTKEELNFVKSELQVNKKELETMLTKQQVDKKELEAMQIELIHKKEEIEIVKKGVNCKDKKKFSLKKDLQDIKEELESVKTEQQGTKEEPESVKTEQQGTKEELESIKTEQGTKEELGTVRTELQTTTTTCCDVKCQELENPMKMTDVGLDLTLGVQNWLPPGVTYSDYVTDLQKYLYGDGVHRGKLESLGLFNWYNWTSVFQDRSKAIITNIDGTKYNVRTKWRVGGEKIEVEVSFHQRGGGVNTLAQYKYFILYSNRNITAGNWFTSVELVDNLKEHGLTYLGRMRIHHNFNHTLIENQEHLFLVDMAEPTLTQEMKRHAVIVSLAAGHTNSETAAFLNVAPSFVFKAQRELGTTKGNVAEVSQRKRHCRHPDSIRKPDLKSRVLAAIDEDPGKSMRALARELQVNEATIQRVVHEDLHYKSYIMRRRQFMSERIKVNCMTRAKRFLNKLNHPRELTPKDEES